MKEKELKINENYLNLEIVTFNKNLYFFLKITVNLILNFSSLK